MSDSTPVRMVDWVRGLNRLQTGIILIVGLSGGTIAVFADAPPEGVLGSILAGLLLGTLLTWYLTTIAPDSGQYNQLR